MSIILQHLLEQILNRGEAQLTYSHLLPAENQLHSRLLNYYGLNRLGTGKWLSISGTHLTVYHQREDYQLLDPAGSEHISSEHISSEQISSEQIRSYQVAFYCLPRTDQVEAFIFKLASADAFFAQQLEQLGTIYSGAANRQKHVLDQIQTLYPAIFTELSISAKQKATSTPTRSRACFVRWQSPSRADGSTEGIFIGIDPNLSASGSRHPDSNHPEVIRHQHSLIIGVIHSFASQDTTSAVAISVSQRDLVDFFDGYTINSKPAFALSFSLSANQYQLWRQLLPDWFYAQTTASNLTARFHFYHHLLKTDIVSQKLVSILQKAIAFNYSLDTITVQAGKQLVKVEPVNSRISTLTWSDGLVEENVYLLESDIPESESENNQKNQIRQFHLTHQLFAN